MSNTNQNLELSILFEKYIRSKTSYLILFSSLIVGLLFSFNKRGDVHQTVKVPFEIEKYGIDQRFICRKKEFSCLINESRKNLKIEFLKSWNKNFGKILTTDYKIYSDFIEINSNLDKIQINKFFKSLEKQINKKELNNLEFYKKQYEKDKEVKDLDLIDDIYQMRMDWMIISKTINDIQNKKNVISFSENLELEKNEKNYFLIFISSLTIGTFVGMLLTSLKNK